MAARISIKYSSGTESFTLSACRVRHEPLNFCVCFGTFSAYVLHSSSCSPIDSQHRRRVYRTCESTFPSQSCPLIHTLPLQSKNTDMCSISTHLTFSLPTLCDLVLTNVTYLPAESTHTPTPSSLAACSSTFELLLTQSSESLGPMGDLRISWEAL